MKKYNEYFTEEKYKKHLLWLKGEEGGERLDLSKKDLSYLDLSDTDLSYANLRGANLRGANLSRAKLSCANLSRAKFKNTIFPDYLSKIKQDDSLIKKIADIVLKDENKLNMKEWHTCDTTHCLAGWAIHLTDNYEAEEKSSAYLVGRLLLGDEVSKMFYKSNEKVIDYLRSIKNGKQYNYNNI